MLLFFLRVNIFELTGGFDIHLFAFAKASEDVELFLRMQQRKLVLWFVSFWKSFMMKQQPGDVKCAWQEKRSPEKMPCNGSSDIVFIIKQEEIVICQYHTTFYGF